MRPAGAGAAGSPSEVLIFHSLLWLPAPGERLLRYGLACAFLDVLLLHFCYNSHLEHTFNWVFYVVKHAFQIMIKIYIVLVVFVSAQTTTLAQSIVDTILKAVPLAETVISANRVSQARSAVAQQVAVISRAQIEQANAQTTADLLQNTGTVFVQKSQQGGGSPTIRGFEASRVLLVVDGVRMNNAIYRAGHLQNIMTMDNAALDRAEVLFGPASTVYGTDALGGAICFYTKNPTFAAAGAGLKTTGNAFLRYGTVNEEKTGHADISLAGGKLGALTSFTYNDFGDLRMGEQNGFGAFFGKRPFYAERINGKDSLLRNSDPYLQKSTGYRQYDLLEKIVFQPNSHLRHTLNVQFSNSSTIPRYDRLTDPGAGGLGLASAEWYYGPQKRLLGAYTFALDQAGWFDGGLRATASYQDVEESRHSRGFGKNGLTSRVEKVKVLGLTVNALKNWGLQSLTLGLDGQYNDVNSTASSRNVKTGDVSPASTRYPDGGSQMSNLAAYATHRWQTATTSTWTFSEGLRVGYSSLSADFTDKTFFNFPFNSIKQQSPVISGHVGAVWNGRQGWRVAVNGSTGFRTPNVDDMTKVFDSQSGLLLVVPNPDLKPEKTLNVDFNVTRAISGRLRWENVLWMTALRDAIVTDLFQFNGQDSVIYDGKLTRVAASQNKRAANLWGLHTGLEADIYTDLAVYAAVDYTHGRVQGVNGEADRPLDHIPPVYGRLGFRWHTAKATVESFVLFNGQKKLADYNLEGEDNLQYARADGMPAWMTLNLRGGYRFSRNIGLQAGLENILDTQYRTFASGINGPGRNLFITLRLGF